MTVMDYVMSETIDSDECDGCDGILKKSTELENRVESKVDCNTNIQEQKEEKEILDKVLNMPSYAERYPLGQLSPKQAKTKTQQKVRDSQVAITVGDKVTVEDCPGHWSWASPFTVEAVEGDLVKLEMVGELVEINKLSCFETNNKN
ncbi:MAG: hypothetical protein HC939_22870 [Pleurocapsa sp. SU_5_0]|nr:hypothetical protein [Pleurocapsa sp. SU_5_0]